MDYARVGPKEGPPLIERVEGIYYDPHRSSDIAMVGSGNNRRWILATENMKTGDLVKTSGEVTDTPGKANVLNRGSKLTIEMTLLSLCSKGLKDFMF